MDWYDLLYIWGVTTERSPFNVAEIKKLYDEYNYMFPDYPLDDSFFEDNNEDEIMRRLKRAIKDQEPIERWTR